MSNAIYHVSIERASRGHSGPNEKSKSSGLRQVYQSSRNVKCWDVSTSRRVVDRMMPCAAVSTDPGNICYGSTEHTADPAFIP